jgi:hypothetical protein
LIVKPAEVATTPVRTPATAKSKAGSPSAVRSIPKTSHTTPSSNGAIRSPTSATTFCNMRGVWQELPGCCQSCHWSVLRRGETLHAPSKGVVQMALVVITLLTAVLGVLGARYGADTRDGRD